MRDRAADGLARTVLRALEEAAFVFAEPVEDAAGAPPFEGEVVDARLAWGGAEPAELRIAVPADLAAGIAANLLGVDDAPGREDDAMGELVNMAAGALVAELHGAADPPPLGLPRVARRAAGGDAAPVAIAAILVDEEGRRIEVAVGADTGRSA